jgi:uncharacterized RDD family membrane protein YckC
MTRDRIRLVLRRLVQIALDLALVAAASATLAILAFLMLILVFGVRGRPAAYGALGTYIGGILVLQAVNEVVLPRRTNGVTVGMEVLGLRVVTLDGGHPTLKAYLIRHLLWVVDSQFWGIVGIVLVLATQRGQRLGDLVAGTVVIRQRSLDLPAESARRSEDQHTDLTADPDHPADRPADAGRRPVGALQLDREAPGGILER